MAKYSEYTQQGRLILYLERHGKIDPLQAWKELGIYRLSDTVYQLRKKGYDIGTRRKNVRNKFGEKCKVAEYFYADDSDF